MLLSARSPRISPINISCAPSEIISLTLHSIFTGHSFIAGERTLSEVIGVKEHNLNLSTFFPDRTPHRSTSLSIATSGMLTTKSPVFFIKRCECLEGLIEILSMGGLEHTTPHHAIVIILAAQVALSILLTSTTGTGNNPSLGGKSVLGITLNQDGSYYWGFASASGAFAFLAAVCQHLFEQ